MARDRIAIIGAGATGSALAHLAGERELGDIVLFDIADGLPQGRALDLAEGAAAAGRQAAFRGVSEYSAIAGAAVVFVAAGVSRRPGMSRHDLLEINLKVMNQAGAALARYARDAFVVCLTEPVGVMTWALQKYSGLPPGRVVGMDGALAQARFRHFLAEEFDVSAKDVFAFVLGADAGAIPIPRLSTVAGVPLPELAAMGLTTTQRIGEIVRRVRDAEAEITGLLKSAPAAHAPAAAALALAESRLGDHRRVLSCTVRLEGEYGLRDFCFSAPAVIGAQGVEKILEVRLERDEKSALKKSAGQLRSLVEAAMTAAPDLA